jgi:hypothetical protein
MAKLIMQIKENFTQEFEIPEFFDFIALEDSLGKHIIQVQKNYLQKEGWVERKQVREVLIKIKEEIQEMTSMTETSLIIDKLFQRRFEELGL